MVVVADPQAKRGRPLGRAVELVRAVDGRPALERFAELISPDSRFEPSPALPAGWDPMAATI